MVRPIRKNRHLTGNIDTDRAIKDLQDDVDESIRAVSQGAFVESRTIQNVSIVAGTPVDVNHRLGRPFTCWVTARLRRDGAAVSPVVFEDSSQPDRSKVIRLDASEDCTFDLVIS